MFFLFILLALLILLVMVTIHEFGHYIAAKILKFKVVEFSVGFGPALFSKKTKSGEKFSLRMLPLGGYCAFETEDEEGKESEKSFFKEKPWKRIIVLLSGAVLNMISAVFFSFMFLAIVGTASTSSFIIANVTYRSNGLPYNSAIQVGDVVTHVNGTAVDLTLEYPLDELWGDISAGDPPAVFTIIRNGNTQNIAMQKTWVSGQTFEGFGFTYRLDNGAALVGSVARAVGGEYFNPLQAGDRIVAVDGVAVTSRTSLASLTQNVALFGQVMLSVSRPIENSDQWQELQIPIIFRHITPAFEAFGISMDTHYQRSIGRAFTDAIPFTGRMSWAIIGSFGQLITGRVSAAYMTGPVGTVSQMASLSQSNWRNILLLLPLLAANLAIFNLIPFPALDGAKIVFTIIEWIRKKPINKKVESMVNLIGFFALMLFVVVIDIVGFAIRAGPSGWVRI